MITRLNWQFLFVIALALSISACDSSDPETGTTTKGVIVANQGNFFEGTGSITIYDPSTGIASQLADNFGSIIQSVTLKGDSLYVMSNSANRIDIVDVESGGRLGQIVDVVSPRYMTITNGSKGFVTNLYSGLGSFSGGSLTTIDLDSGTVSGSVDVGENPEGVIAVGPRLFVANSGFGNDSTLTVLDQTSGTPLGFVDLGCYGPRFLTVDSDAEIFVFCSGRTVYDVNFNVIGEIDGEVVVLDGTTATEIKRIPVNGRVQTAGGSGQDIFHSFDTNQIFFVKDGNKVVCINTLSNLITEEFAVSGDPIGAIAYDNLEKELYLGRVPGFDQSGTVTIHNESGDQTGSFSAGIAPSHIVFYRAEQ